MRTLGTLILCATFTASAAAQGSLSSQGFGYPAGGLSTHAAALGGSIAESDALSPVNPATLVTWGRPGFYFQYDPEFRTVNAPGASDHGLTARFPLLAGALNITPRFSFGVSGTTFLDRTWRTTRAGYIRRDADSTLYTERFSSDGAIEDVQAGLAYSILPTLSVGVAGHVLTGQNRLLISRQFADTGFAVYAQASTLSYSGHSVSAGITWRPLPTLSFGASGNAGGTLHSFRNDTTLSSARVPKRLGFGALYGGLTGVIFSANAEWNGWSAMNGLAQSEVLAVDGWDWGVGAEVRAPSLFGAELPVRIGYRHRILPFEADGLPVHETDYSFGFGFPLSRGRSRIDLSVARAIRSASLDVSEHAWTLSAGILVRP
jgi:hypothetical protein